MRIFISYSRVDRPIVDELVQRISRVYPTANIWFDRELTGGDDWWAEIVRQINMCDIFIFLMSNESIESAYCRKEYAHAKNQSKRILPVQVRARTKIPTELATLHYVDLSKGENDPDGVTDLLAALNKLSQGISTNTPTPAFPSPAPDWTGEPLPARPFPQAGNMEISNVRDSTVISGVSNSTIHIGGEAQEREARRQEEKRAERAAEDDLFDNSSETKARENVSPLRLVGVLILLSGLLVGIGFIIASDNDVFGVAIALVSLVFGGIFLGMSKPRKARKS